jgi:hypothetical protein
MNIIEGSYTLRQTKLYSSDRPQILHIRQRKHIRKPSQTPLFLAVHQPGFEYISNLYWQQKGDPEIKPGSTDLPESCTLFIDYKGTEYRLEKAGSAVEIRRHERDTSTGSVQAKLGRNSVLQGVKS